MVRMKFAATIEYSPDKDKISQIRPTHRVYLAKMKAEGKLVVAGPFADFSGGLIVYEAETREQAEQYIKDDPFYTGGVFVSWVIRPWVVVMTNREMLPEVPPT
jgi:uncharacterized protein